MITLRQMQILQISSGCLKHATIFVVLLPAIMLLTVPTASAQMTAVNGCMQDIAGFELGCTANDIQISGVATQEIQCPGFWDSEKGVCLRILDDGCAFPGDDVTFTAVFEVLSTAKRRHDIGIYFVTDGDPNGDGAISGECSISTLPFAPGPPWLDLDGTSDDPGGVIQDTCGDIRKPDRNPLFPRITLTASCVDADGDGKLNLPNCTSWRQFGANELCTSPLQAFPGSPSKCRCDDGFNVPIDIPPAELAVAKTADPTSIDEPSGSVTFSVTVTNIGIDPNNKVTLNSLLDDIYNDITTTGHDGITSTTCAVPQKICPDVPTAPCDTAGGEFSGTYSCSFTATVSGNAGDSETDTVTARGVDDNNNPLSGLDTATVTINGVDPSIAVAKLANGEESTTVPEPGADVTFSVAVTNTSVSSDPVTIDSITDDIHGDITLARETTCSTPQTIQPGDTYNCSFIALVAGNYLYSETDTVTASGTDDDGTPVSGSDSATVQVTNVLSSIEFVKTVTPLCDPDGPDGANGTGCVDEPGGQVTYTYKVTNTSTVDTVTIDTLTDDKLANSDLNGQGDCSLPQVLADNGGMYTCSVTTDVFGNAFDVLTNTGTASGIDDDGEPVTAMDPATVTFNNVPPDASLMKTAETVVVTYKVIVTNLSDAEQLTLGALSDDKFGDITKVQGDVLSTTCAIPQTLEKKGSAGDAYMCTFDGKVSLSPHTNTVTGTVDDDDMSLTIEPSDSATVTFE